MTKQQRKIELKAVNLLFDYYRYFCNCDNAKAMGRVHNRVYYRWDSTSNSYVTEDKGIAIYLRKYKNKKKRVVTERLKQLFLLSPDMDTELEIGTYYDVIKVKSIDLDLPSIKNNSLGFERDTKM